jgi:hypothetical protein
MKRFVLGVVTVTINLKNGKQHVEDWDPQDADEAREYASETARCSDVAAIEFWDNRTNEKRLYVGRD